MSIRMELMGFSDFPPYHFWGTRCRARLCLHHLSMTPFWRQASLITHSAYRYHSKYGLERLITSLYVLPQTGQRKFLLWMAQSHGQARFLCRFSFRRAELKGASRASSLSRAVGRDRDYRSLPSNCLRLSLDTADSDDVGVSGPFFRADRHSGRQLSPKTRLKMKSIFFR
jgi:hypothetical protein